MKSLVLILILSVSLNSCKTENKTEKTSDPVEKQLTIAEEIAYAHGFEHWNKVKTFEFTFGGKMEEPNSGRSWKWNPKSSDVTLMTSKDTISYNRSSMDSSAIKADRAFINDKFWALIPFQLVWDEVEYKSDSIKASPISKTQLNKLTITYPAEGGYTPGDAYDIYYDKEYIIKEWSFRKGNAAEPSLSNTFENYQDFNGLKIALEHKRSKDDWNLLIRNIKVELED